MFVKIFKKNQIVFMTLGVILIVAGYLNYTYNPELRYQTEITGNIEETLGDTIYVNALPNNNINESINTQNEIQQKIDKIQDEYFINTRSSRDKMFDEQLDLYTGIIENTQLSNEAKEKANEQIKEINNLKNSIMIAENLILLKEIEDVIILTNGNNINVIVKSNKELEKEKVAQLYSIVSKELEVDINNIQIMLKK